MTDILTVLYEFYMTPRLETDEVMALVAALYRELPPVQQERCARLLEEYACQSFLLGIRAGADLEQFLTHRAIPGQPH